MESSRQAHPEWDICALDELEEKYDKNNIELFVAISQFQMLNRVRKDTFNTLKERGFHFATLISPTATILSDSIGEGSWIRNFAYLSTETKIGRNTIIDIYSNIAHYSKVGNRCFVGIRAIALGSVTIGDQCFIGADSTIFNDVTIGTKCLIGGGDNNKKDVPSYTRCKLPNDGVIMKQYDGATIEMKLLPPEMVKKAKIGANNAMKRAIVTGATGAIGTALVQDLISKGIEVLVFCREGSKRNIQIPEHKLVTKKFCALSELADVQNDTGKDYDVFYHFAWGGTTGVARNDMYLQNENVRFALDAVSAAKRFGCHTFVGAGSQAEYGRVEGVLKPGTPVFPEMGYGIAKLCAGQMTREYAHQLGLKHIWTRILSVYGPNDGAQSMVMSTINKLKKGEVPQFTKGEQMWDYLYSGDAAEAFRLIGEKGVDGRVYVLGSGHAQPLAEYIRMIRDIVAPGGKIELGAIPYAEKQVMHLEADISQLKQDTGFEPKTDFCRGLKIMTRKL